MCAACLVSYDSYIQRAPEIRVARSQTVINQACKNSCSEFYKTVHNSVLNYVVETKSAVKFQRRLMATIVIREKESWRETYTRLQRLQKVLIILLGCFRYQNKFHFRITLL